MTFIIIGIAIAAFLIISNLLVYRRFKDSLPSAPEIRNRIVTWAELALPPLSSVTLASRQFVVQTYQRASTNGFTLWFLIIVIAGAAVCGISMFAEYGFTQFTFARSLDETPDTRIEVLGYPLSGILALLAVIVPLIAGLMWFERLGQEQPADRAEETTDESDERTLRAETVNPEDERDREAEVRRKTRDYRYKTVAVNALLVMGIAQACLGYLRGDEFILTANLQAQMAGNDPASTGSGSLTISLVNALLGFLMPFITAFTTRYMLTLLSWISASLLAALLFIILWLPTWILNGAVVRYQQQHGPPVTAEADNAAPRATGEAARAGGEADPIRPGHRPTDVPPASSPGPAPVNERQEAFNQRAQEEREELDERREAERRRREQANANPFGAEALEDNS
jgi:hypothetical protein